MSIWTLLKKIYSLIMEFIDRLDKNHIYLNSAGIAFNILLYQIPLFLLLTFFVDITIGFENLAPQLEGVIREFLPPTETSEEYISTILNETLNILKHSTIFGFVGIIFLIWLSSTLISSLRYSLNGVFKIPPKDTAILDMLKDMFLVFAIPFLFIIYTFLLPIVDIVLNLLSDLSPDKFQGIVSEFTVIITSLGTGFIIYYFIYSYIPSKKIERKKRLYVSLLNTILIEASRNIFAWYLVSISQYGKYYGGYATIVSIVLWIYYFSFIFLISAEIIQIIFEKQEKRIRNSGGTLNLFNDN